MLTNGALQCIQNDFLSYCRFDSFFTERLVNICDHAHFDGYLVNIEIPYIPPNLLRMLPSFLKKLRDGLHELNPDAQVIWYDSIDSRGYLNYQNKVSRRIRNGSDVLMVCFSIIGGLPEDLNSSVLLAKSRLLF